MTESTGYPGCRHIDGAYGETKDFLEIIEQAKKCPPPTEIETGEIVGGRCMNRFCPLADKVVDAVKSGAIKKFVVMAGSDGRGEIEGILHRVRQETAKGYGNTDLPDAPNINIISCRSATSEEFRVLDAGQCNDSYSLALIAPA